MPHTHVTDVGQDLIIAFNDILFSLQQGLLFGVSHDVNLLIYQQFILAASDDDDDLSRPKCF